MRATSLVRSAVTAPIGLQEEGSYHPGCGTVASATSDRRILLFLHIPKTAGTSLRTTLCNLFGDRHVLHVTASFDRHGQHIDQLMQSELSEIDCITGHLPRHVWQQHMHRLRPFTLLRDPVARVFSLFRFLQRGSREALAEIGLQPGFTLDEFLTTRAPGTYGQVNNGICRMLSGDPRLGNGDDPQYWSVREVELASEAAFGFLSRSEFGLVEEMQATLRFLQHGLGVPYPIAERHENATAQGPGETMADIRRVVAMNMADIALYRAASALFHERCAAAGSLRGGFAGGHVARGIWQMPLGGTTSINEIPGRTGFHPYEPTGFAWMMATEPPQLHFLPPPDVGSRQVRLTLRLYMITADYDIEGVSIHINGIRQAVTLQDRDGHWCTIVAEPIVFEAGAQWLRFELPYAVPLQFLAPTSGDRRSLGIALANVGLDLMTGAT